MKKNSKGQTIVELLVALTLITLFLSGVVVIQLYAIRNVQYAQKRSIATKLAREQLERIRVVRDSVGIDSLSVCMNPSSCYINNQLTPIPISPTGSFGQSIQLSTSSNCPPPDVTPVPEIYEAISSVSWDQGENLITPAPTLSLSSCITQWR